MTQAPSRTSMALAIAKRRDQMFIGIIVIP